MPKIIYLYKFVLRDINKRLQTSSSAKLVLMKSLSTFIIVRVVEIFSIIFNMQCNVFTLSICSDIDCRALKEVFTSSCSGLLVVEAWRRFASCIQIDCVAIDDPPVFV